MQVLINIVKLIFGEQIRRHYAICTSNRFPIALATRSKVDRPALLQTISDLFILQHDLPFPVFSNLLNDAPMGFVLVGILIMKKYKVPDIERNHAALGKGFAVAGLMLTFFENGVLG